MLRLFDVNHSRYEIAFHSHTTAHLARSPCALRGAIVLNGFKVSHIREIYESNFPPSSRIRRQPLYMMKILTHSCALFRYGAFDKIFF